MNYSFEINQAPVPQARPRVTKWGTYDPKAKEKKQFKTEIREKWPHSLLNGPLRVDMTFVMPIPKSLSEVKKRALRGKPHIKKIDLSNIYKFIEDCMTDIVYEDDSLIWDIKIKKIYGINPKIFVMLETTEDQEPL